MTSLQEDPSQQPSSSVASEDSGPTDESASAAEDAPPSRALYALAALGTASALWSIFLWSELLKARAGAKPFCGFGESADCGSLWSAAFATTVHQTTGLPVAGWGLVWGLVATLLPLIALAYAHLPERAGAARSGIDWVAGGGVVGVAVLLAASAQERLFCSSCALTYVLTLAYGAVVLYGMRRHPRARLVPGAMWAGGLSLVAFLVLLYPGLRTPKSLQANERQALAAAAMTQQAAQEAEAGGGMSFDKDARLNELLAGLPPQALQGISDSLEVYRRSAYFTPEQPRTVTLGQLGAPVLITEFTDMLCGHCATLHQTLAYLATLVPPSAFFVDARHFPLDGNCNRHLTVRGEESVRCMAARAQLCLEPTGRLFEASGELFKNQKGLTADDVYRLTAPFIERAELDQCMAAEDTATKLRQDVDYAWRFRPTGTPLVLVNGRQGTQFGPFLFAMILSEGRADHPAFNVLPPPRPPEPGHEGHMH
ncbi:MAG: thioredoxin domain-containing protein [Acidobacteriota bacterium]